MGLCTKRRIHVMFLLVTVLQIVTTCLRQVSDFLGPLWALILTNFFNIVFCIFGFFGGYTRRKYFVIPYIVWSILWTGWNILIFSLYIPSLGLGKYKTSILSVGTGGFSWWETRAPGCRSVWISGTQLEATNCYFDPNILEGLLASIQIYLAIWGICAAFAILCCPYHPNDEEKGDHRSIKSSDYYTSRSTVPAFMSLTRSTGSTSRRHSSLGRPRNNTSTNRIAQRGPLGLPEQNQTKVNADTLNHSGIDDKLRPMTPRKVKRRSARSIQSSKFGPGNAGSTGNSPAKPENTASTSRGAHFSGNSGGSGRNSLRSNHSSGRKSTNRNSKRKQINSHSQFVSPINRLMQQQQLDSETSHDEPRYHPHLRDMGHVNPVAPQSASENASGTAHAPPRPPSARSSYSNYHPARLPPMSAANTASIQPNAYNLDQTLFTNPAYDSSVDYNDSMLSHHTNFGYYDDEVQLRPSMGVAQFHNSSNHIPPVPIPRPFNIVTPNNLMAHTSHSAHAAHNAHSAHNAAPSPPIKNFADLMFHQQQNSKSTLQSLHPSNHPTLTYPLAHSPVSQESFPMWGVAQAQVPTQSPGVQSSSSGYPPLTPITNRYANPPTPLRLQKLHHSADTNSETVI